MTVEETLLALTLRQQGLSQREIGERLGMRRETVCRGLHEAGNVAGLLEVKAILEAAAEEYSTDWIRTARVGSERGRHEPAMDALPHMKVIEPFAKDVSSGIQVIIGVPLPGMPGCRADAGIGQAVVVTLPGEPLPEPQV